MLISTLPSTLKAQVFVFFFFPHKQLYCREAAKGRFSPNFKNEDTEVWKVRNIPTQTSPWHTGL